MIVSLGLDFRRADVALRERFHRGAEELGEVYAPARRAAAGAEELVALATCNRIELYVVVEQARWRGGEAARDLAGLWAEGTDPARVFASAAVVRRGTVAARHLMRLASGLESQVLGDIHILGQLRRDYRRALEADAVGGRLHRLFDIALRAGKRVRSDTRLMTGFTSVGTEGARLALERTGAPGRCRFVVVGCGKTGEHAARALAEAGVGTLTLLNRTRSRADRLADELGAGVAPFADRHRVAARADAVLVATGADRPLLLAPAIARHRPASGRGDPLLVLDLAMPRNVDPEVGEIPGVVRIDLDLLDPDAAAVEEARYRSVADAEEIVEEHVEEYRRWLEESVAREALVPLRRLLDDVCARELEGADDEVDPQATASRIVAKVMARPMSAMRAAAASGDSIDSLTGALGELFGGRRPAAAGAPDATARNRFRQEAVDA